MCNFAEQIYEMKVRNDSSEVQSDDIHQWKIEFMPMLDMNILCWLWLHYFLQVLVMSAHQSVWSDVAVCLQHNPTQIFCK